MYNAHMYVYKYIHTYMFLLLQDIWAENILNMMIADCNVM